jgi:hypothetical protein
MPDRIRDQLAHVPMGMRIEVTDSGESASEPVLCSDDPDRTSGCGLFLVARLAERWGVQSDRTTTVWCELDLSPAASS